MSSEEREIDKIHFYQAGQALPSQQTANGVREKVKELFNVKNLNFLLGAGASASAIPGMKALKQGIDKDITNQGGEVAKLYAEMTEANLEKLLGLLYARKFYLEGSIGPNEDLVHLKELINYIESFIFKNVNIDSSQACFDQTFRLYTRFYQKVALRNKDLARTSIFTTNYDLLSEKALDFLNINYNNGFGGGVTKVFNPARFKYTYSKKIDPNMEKFEPIDNMVYLYKLHGSINWVERAGNSLFSIQEILVSEGTDKTSEDHILIYPTPMKQSQSLGSPYSDLIREFQSKLSLPNSVLFIIGYSFGDEHLNHIIYQSLSSNSSISIVIFGECKDNVITTIEDNRIYRIFGEAGNGAKVHYFDYVVNEILPHAEDDKDERTLKNFIRQLSEKGVA